MNIPKMKTIPETLKLYLLDAENPKALIENDTFLNEDNGRWYHEIGDWHCVTIDTNVDQSTGLDGGLLVGSYGTYYSGITYKDVELSSYGEVTFEWYLHNDKLYEAVDTEEEGESEANPEYRRNYMVFYIDGVERVRISKPTPWERIKPIGLAPGKHTFSFEYFVGEDGLPNGKKATFNNFQVWQSERIFCKIRDYKPATAESELSESKTIRGYTRVQEMTESDSVIKFQAIIYAEHYQHFQRNMRKIFYFVDEFGIAYRGIFRTKSPDKIALGSVYSFDLELISDSRTGYGFC